MRFMQFRPFMPVRRFLQGAASAPIPRRASLSPLPAALLPAATVVLAAMGALGAIGLGALGLGALGCAATRAGSAPRPLASPAARAPAEAPTSHPQAAPDRQGAAGLQAADQRAAAARDPEGREGRAPPRRCYTR